MSQLDKNKPMNNNQSTNRGRQVKIDPHSDKLAFFKDNIRDEEDSNFDPHIYYYNRQDKEHEMPRQPQQPSYPKKDMRRDEAPYMQHKQSYQQPQHLPQQSQQTYQQVQYQPQHQHQANGPKNTQPRQQHVPVSPQKQSNQRSMMYNQSNSQQRGETKQILKEPLNDSNPNLNASGNITIQSNLNTQASITIQSNAMPNNQNVPSARAPPNAQVNAINNLNQVHQQPQASHNNFLTNSGTFVNTMANASNVFHTHSNVLPNNDIHSNVNMLSSASPPPSISSLANHQSNSLPVNLANPALAANNAAHLNLSNNSGNVGLSGLAGSSGAIHNGASMGIPLNSSAGIPQDPSLMVGNMSDLTGYPNGRGQPQPDGAGDDQYDLLGLLKVLKMTNLNLNILAFGTDLTTLGLNLSSTDVLHTTFASPFSSTPLKQEPNHSIPDCYFINPPLAVPTDKMNLFSDETLFYIFYGMPNDVLQVAAAVELAARDWSYHTELRVWFQRLPGSTPLVKAMNYETGSYIYFDIQQWKDKTKTNFQMEYEKLYSPKT